MMVEVDYNRITPRPDLVPPKAAEVLSKVFGYGILKHAENEWRAITIKEHVYKAWGHLQKLQNNVVTTQEDHLANALCRLYMAVELREEDSMVKQNKLTNPDRTYGGGRA